MPFTLDAVDEFAMGLPGVTVGTRWNKRTWLVNERGFVWVRPLGKTDLERLGDTPPPRGDIVGISTGDLDAKDALLAMDLPGFFTIQHFNGFPAVLVALKQARAKDVRAAITEAHRVIAAMAPKRGARRSRVTAGSGRRTRSASRGSPRTRAR